jgi:hypothetical protein
MASESEQRVKEMPLDDFIEFMFSSGRYDADPATGSIWNAASGLPLRTFPDRRGYLQVNLVFSRKVVRRCKVHRVIAVKAWGAERVGGKQVGHRNGVKTDNAVTNLWLPESPKDHYEHDVANDLWGTKPPKGSWEPCVRCGNPNGRIGPRKLTPIRISGKRFGIAGKLCDACYSALRKRQVRAKRRVGAK